MQMHVNVGIPGFWVGVFTSERDEDDSAGLPQIAGGWEGGWERKALRDTAPLPKDPAPDWTELMPVQPQRNGACREPVS